jgi:hypothetical protein
MQKMRQLILADLRQLSERSKELIYAEKQDTPGELFTIKPYKRLAASFSNKVPNAAVFGAKGAGKTFLFKMLSNISEWSKFCSICGVDDADNALLIPIYWSHNENYEGRKFLINSQIKSLSRINKCISDDKIIYNHQLLRTIFSTPQKKLPSDWRELWFKFFCQCLGFSVKNEITYESEFRKRLSAFTTPVVYLCDGLEDLFSEWLFQDMQIEPLRVLIQDILLDIPIWGGGKFGLLIFIRKDLVRHAVTQNSGQYFANFRDFEIKWSKEEALRLIGGLFSTQELLQYRSYQSSNEWSNRDFHSMCNDLIPLWGLKLGSTKSFVPPTVYWVLSCVSDLQGNFQARDILRFLNKAAGLQIRRPLAEDRLLSPSALRAALKASGEDKIEEVKQEMKHIASDLEKISFWKPALPLTCDSLEKIGISSTAALEEAAILHREGAVFYLPEIYRKGFGLELSKVTRNKVYSLMKKAWKKALE